MVQRVRARACASLCALLWACGPAPTPPRVDALEGEAHAAPQGEAPTDARVKVVLLLGQSNMVGLGLRRDLAPEALGPTRALIHAEGQVSPRRAGRWTPLEVGFGRSEESFGPELSLGLALERGSPRGSRVALIKHAVGGTSLAEDWRPGSPLFEESLDHVARALEELRADAKAELIGVVWMQGESDAQDERQASAYEPNLRAWVLALRRRLRHPGLPVVVGRISTAPAWTYADEVRAAQARASDALPSVETVETDDLPRQEERADPLHYASDGLWTLGERFAASLLALHPPTPAWPPAASPPLQGEGGWFWLEGDQPMRWDGARWVAARGPASVDGARVRAGRQPVSVVWRAPASVEVLATGAWALEDPDACAGLSPPSVHLAELPQGALFPAQVGAPFTLKRRLAQGEALQFVLTPSEAPAGCQAARLRLALEVAWDRR